MPAALPKSRVTISRALFAALVLMGTVGTVETGVLCWHFLTSKPTPVALPAAQPSSSKTVAAASATPAPKNETLTAEQQLVAAAVEKSLVAALPKATPSPTPLPARPPVTPASRVAELINLARELRDRGDTGTAMSRLREAQAIYSNYAPIVSEMAITYEKMGLTDKAIEQWRRIYEMGERAGIYYAAAEAKLRALQLPDAPPQDSSLTRPANGALTPDATPADIRPVMTLGKVGTTDDTGTTQPLRRLKLRIPIHARPGSRVDPRSAVIQVFFYDQLKDGSIVETNANVTSSWARRISPSGDVLPVDWSSPEPEVLEVEYAQQEFDPKDPRTRERRNYFGYSVRVYYKGVLDAKFADPVKLLTQFIPPATLPSSDLPQ